MANINLHNVSEQEEALMLAITAPTQELADECTLMATQIGYSLTNKQRELARMGIEVALEYA